MAFLKIQYQHGCYLEKKEKNAVAFQSGEVSTKKKNMRVGRNDNLEELFDWFIRMRMNNLPISGTVLKEKAMSYAQELQVEEFHASNRLFEWWKIGNFFYVYAAIVK